MRSLLLPMFFPYDGGAVCGRPPEEPRSERGDAARSPRKPC